MLLSSFDVLCLRWLTVFLTFADNCGEEQFRCKSDGLCIALNQVQDRIQDCLDGSDEECSPNDHRCHCGLPVCLDPSFVGDGIDDCLDGSDEGPAKLGKCKKARALQELIRNKRDSGN